MPYPALGKAAPKFTTVNQHDETVSLKDFKGKTLVLYFYPKAMTPGCTSQACGIRDFKQDFEKLDAVVVGISIDPAKRLQKFIEKETLNFDLLADEDHQIAEQYGVWGLKKFMGREFMGLIRTTFIIDKNGKLEQVINKFKTKTHHETVLEYLRNR